MTVPEPMISTSSAVQGSSLRSFAAALRTPGSNSRAIVAMARHVSREMRFPRGMERSPYEIAGIRALVGQVDDARDSAGRADRGPQEIDALLHALAVVAEAVPAHLVQPGVLTTAGQRARAASGDVEDADVDRGSTPGNGVGEAHRAAEGIGRR